MIDLRIGDSRQLIHELADKSIDCVVTSPPYWGLRDYKTEPIIFDGLPDCEHEWGNLLNISKEECSMQRCKDGKRDGMAYKLQDSYVNQGSFCLKCNAWRGSLGLEPTPELFIKHLLDFFDDVKLKLKDKGNCFVNLGDTYAGSGCGTNDYRTEKSKSINGIGKNAVLYKTGGIAQKIKSIPAKCLCMIPQRFAWGMIERGWILRNSIVWAKPNHMPESVTDRLTKAHEVIYHFVQQGKYYYDLDAIREPHKTESIERYSRSVQLGCNAVQGKILQREEQGLGYPRHAPKWFIEGQEPESFGSPRARAQREKHSENTCRTTSCLHDGRNPLDVQHPNGKNPGDVWNITTQPYSEAHFAVFPLELVRRPILAGCPPKGTVLDTFAGSGTVGEFCRHNDRNAILFELNPDYAKLIQERAMLNIPELSTFAESVV